MLSDDISKGVNQTVGGVARVYRGAVKGAVMFGIAAFVIGAIVTAIPLIATAFAAASSVGIMSGIGIVIGKLLSGAALKAGLGWAMYGAIGGAAVLGVTSLIPGFGGDGASRKSDAPAEQRGPAPAQERSRAPEMGQSRKAMPMPENPNYREGHVAALAQRDAAAAAQAAAGTVKT